MSSDSGYLFVSPDYLLDESEPRPIALRQLVETLNKLAKAKETGEGYPEIDRDWQDAYWTVDCVLFWLKDLTDPDNPGAVSKVRFNMTPSQNLDPLRMRESNPAAGREGFFDEEAT